MTVEACAVVGERGEVGEGGAAAEAVIGLRPGGGEEGSVLVLAF